MSSAARVERRKSTAVLPRGRSDAAAAAAAAEQGGAERVRSVGGFGLRPYGNRGQSSHPDREHELVDGVRLGRGHAGSRFWRAGNHER